MSKESWSAPSEQPGDVFSWQAYTTQEGPPRKWPRKEEKESRRTPSTLSNNIQATSESSDERLKSQWPYTVSIPQSPRDSTLKG
jgi:hypothetical protein